MEMDVVFVDLQFVQRPNVVIVHIFGQERVSWLVAWVLGLEVHRIRFSFYLRLLHYEGQALGLVRCFTYFLKTTLLRATSGQRFSNHVFHDGRLVEVKVSRLGVNSFLYSYPTA